RRLDADLLGASRRACSIPATLLCCDRKRRWGRARMTGEHDILERARRFALELGPRGAEIEAARRIPRDISVAMGEAGFYRLFLTAACGGPEVSPRTAAEVVEALAQGDAACGWVVFIAVTTTLA